jgi:alkylhydroperoxidase family enzyme
VIGPFNLALQSPEIGAAFAKLQSTEESSTTLNPRIRQIVILTVGAMWKCDYERYAHKAVAEKVGLAPQVIHAVAEGSEPQGLAEDESLAWQVTGTSRWITGYLRIFSTGHNQLSEIRGSSICCSLLGVMSLFALC